MSAMQELKFTATNDSITVIWQGKPVTVKRGSPNFEGLRKACLEFKWDEIPHHLRSDSSLERWAKGKFKVNNGAVSYNGEALPSELNARIVEMATLGADPTPVMRFWERLQNNPSQNSVKQLWKFLTHIGIPFTSDGCFLAYKAVRADWKDVHTGTIDNSVGRVVTMPRNKVADDPRSGCNSGLHAGALEYASTFHPGGRMVIVKIDPADVVSVPEDHSWQKMRVCKYEVIGVHGEGHLPSTTIEDSELPKKVSDNKRRSKEFQRLDGLDESLLMKESLDTLRQYAAKGLGIVNASRILGGKWSLIQVIVKSRP